MCKKLVSREHGEAKRFADVLLHAHVLVRSRTDHGT
jgi:hypothetical protein